MKEQGKQPNHKLKRERELRGWSQQKVAERVETSDQAVNRWENGQHKTSKHFQTKLCELFGKSAEELGFIDTVSMPVENVQTDQEKEHISEQVISSLPEQNYEAQQMLSLLISEGIDVDKLRRMLLKEALGLMVDVSIPGEAFLLQCASSIKTCWYLLQGKGLTVAEELLSVYTPTLMTLTFRPSKYQETAASLAAQAKILQAVLSMHKLNFVAREIYCHEAVQCSNLSGDSGIQAAALMYLAYTYTYCLPRKPEKAVLFYQEALRILGREVSLLRSDIYMGLADAYAQCKEEEQAVEAIGFAKKHFPAYPEQDPRFLYADCRESELYQWEGKMYLDLAQYYPDRGYYKQADEAFSTSVKLQSIAERSTSETIIHRADALRGLGDLDLYVKCLEEGVSLAQSLGSWKRYKEASDIFQRTPEKWRKEQKIRILAKDVFQQMLGKGILL
jgi:transcriptional regulator with XRE-family HTH domain